MRRLFFLVATATIITTGCNNNKKPGDVTITDKDGKEKVTVNLNDMQSKAAEMEKKKEELAKLTPMSLEELKALVPESIGGATRSSYESNASMGAVMVNAHYKIDDSTNVKVTIFDCAGNAGSSFYGLQYLTLFRGETDNDREYSKTIDFNGGKGVMTCRKDRKDCTLVYSAGVSDRFLITLDGNNVDGDGLKSFADKLNVK